MQINEDDIKDWFLGKARPEVAQAIETDLSRRGPISRLLARPTTPNAAFGSLDEQVTADLQANSLDSEYAKAGSRAMRPALGRPILADWLIRTQSALDVLLFKRSVSMLAAAAAIFLIGTLGYLAYLRRPDKTNDLAGGQTPAAQVAALEQQAKALQNAAADSPEVASFRKNLVAAPVEVAALAWQSSDILALMARTQPKAAEAIQAEWQSQVGRLQAAATGPEAAPVLSYKRMVQASIRQYAGETGERLDPPLEAFLLEARPGGHVGMIIPHYFYSMDETDQAAWNRIVSLAGPQLPVKIVNTRQVTEDLKPGSDYLRAYGQALDQARERGVEVYAFVNCDGGNKPLEAAKKEVERWHELLGKRVRGIYFDNQPMDADERVDFFASLFRHTRSLEPDWRIISATDRRSDEAYMKLDDHNILCYKSVGDLPRFTGWEKPYGSERFAAVVYNAAQLDEAELKQTAAVFGWVFLTSPSEQSDPHKHLPEYLEKEAAILRSLNSQAKKPDAPADSRPRNSRSA